MLLALALSCSEPSDPAGPEDSSLDSPPESTESSESGDSGDSSETGDTEPAPSVLDCATGEPAEGVYGLEVSAMAPGLVQADTLPGWAHPELQVFQAGYWGSDSLYVGASDPTRQALWSTVCSRDVSVTTWTRHGILRLRQTDDGRGLYVYLNAEARALEIGLFTDHVDGVGFRYEAGVARHYVLYSTDALDTLLPGYDPASTDGDSFTFSAVGFDIVASFNGQEFLRLKEYRHMESGRVGLQPAPGYGFRDLAVEHSDSVVLASTDQVLDLRDFGVREASTPATAAVGSPVLTLQQDIGLEVGDFVIAAGPTAPGAAGVGGSWPARSYPDEQALQADQPPDGTYAWVEQTGAVWRRTGGAWAKNDCTHCAYTERAIPRALQGRVVEVSGLSVTLDTSAAWSGEVQLHLDVGPILNRLMRRPAYDGEVNHPLETRPNDWTDVTPEDLVLQLPAGRLAVGWTLVLRDHPGWVLRGDGTTLFSPDGAPSASLWVAGSPGAQVRDLTLEGNARRQGYGLQWSPNLPAVTDTDLPQGRWAPYGVLFGQGSEGAVAEDLVVRDVFQSCVGASFVDDVWARRVDCELTDGLLAYVQWMFQWADTRGGGCEDCSVTSPTLVPGFEGFKAQDLSFSGLKGDNAVLAMNGAGGFLVRDSVLVVRADSQDPRWFSAHNPMVNINTNAADALVALGGRLEGVDLQVEGFVNGDGDGLFGVVVNADNPSIELVDVSYDGPDHDGRSAMAGPVGLVATGQDTLALRFTSLGTVDGAKWPLANVYLADGTLQDCVAETWRVGDGAVESGCAVP